MSGNEEQTRCPECGAPWSEGQTCTDDFHQMLFWESENPKNWAVHHLMVLCYHLQHPNLYSMEGLRHSMGLLQSFLEEGISTQEIRRRSVVQVDSGKRTWTVTSRPDDHGAYHTPPGWKMTARDVVAAGEPQYLESVRRWAGTVLESLRASGNLPASK